MIREWDVEAKVTATYWFSVMADSQAGAITEAKNFDPDMQTWTKRFKPDVKITDLQLTEDLDEDESEADR